MKGAPILTIKGTSCGYFTSFSPLVLREKKHGAEHIHTVVSVHVSFKIKCYVSENAKFNLAMPLPAKRRDLLKFKRQHM